MKYIYLQLVYICLPDACAVYHIVSWTQFYEHISNRTGRPFLRCHGKESPRARSYATALSIDSKTPTKILPKNLNKFLKFLNLRAVFLPIATLSRTEGRETRLRLHQSGSLRGQLASLPGQGLAYHPADQTRWLQVRSRITPTKKKLLGTGIIKRHRETKEI